MSPPFCSAVTAKGTRCSRGAVGASHWCWQHSRFFSYPDSGQLLEDHSILVSALEFGIPTRVYRLENLLGPGLEHLQPQALAFTNVEAYAGLFAATEDILGWLLVLHRWRPGTAAGSLFLTADSVQMKPKDEQEALHLLDDVRSNTFRRLFHLPGDAELARQGWSAEERDAVTQSIPAKVDGLRRVIDLRRSEGRRRVAGFNKYKHMMLAIPTEIRGRPEILLASASTKLSDRGVGISAVWIEPSVSQARRYVAQAISLYAALWDTLALIRSTRFGEDSSPPAWLRRILQVQGVWETDPPP